MINLINGTTVKNIPPNNSLQKNEKNSLSKTENSSAANKTVENSTAAQVNIQAAKSSSHSEDALENLQKMIRKEYLDRNYYIDEETKVPVLQLVNSETEDVIGQYPSDLYLNLIMEVRENQKEMVNQNQNYRSKI